MRRRRTTRLLTPLLCLLLLHLAPAAPAGARGVGDGNLGVAEDDLTVADYCEMTQALLEVSLREWQARVDAAAEKKGDRRQLLRALEDVGKRHRAQREEVYRRYRTSPAADLRYASDHRSEIDGYLEENPDVRDAIDSLKARIDALIQQFESATPAPTEGARR